MTNPDREELVKLADRLAALPTFKMEIVTTVPGVALNAAERDLIVTALRRLAEAGTQEAVKGACHRIALEHFDYYSEKHRAAVMAGNNAVYQAMSIGMSASEKIAKAIDALETSAPPAPSVAVKVKALEWSLPYVNDNDTLSVTAHSSCGRYIATCSGWFLCGQTNWFDVAGIEAAKAAAQADYEARIMAAIEIAPQSDRRPSPSQKQVSETGKELPENAEQPMNNADVSVGELAGFFVTEFPHLLTMSTQIEVARALLDQFEIRSKK